MKIIYPGYGKFFFELYPLWKRLCAFTVPTLFAMVMFIVGMGKYEIACLYKTYGEAKDCSLNYTVFNIYSSSTPLGQLLGAEVRNETGRKGATYNYIILKTNTGFIQPTKTRVGAFSKVSETARAVNNYIQSSLSNTLQLHFFHNNIKYFMILLGMISAYGGLYMLLLASNITIDFNKANGSLFVKQSNAFSRKEASFHLANEDKISIERKEYGVWDKIFFSLISSERNNKTSNPVKQNTFVAEQNNKGFYYCLSVTKKNGDIFPITDYFTNEFNEIRKMSQLMNSVITPPLYREGCE